MNYDQSVLKDYDTYGNKTVSQFDMDELPSGGATVDQAGNFFTDAWTTLKAWLNSARTLIVFINAFPTILAWIGIPTAIAFAFNVLWHAMGVLALVLFLRGD
jgi:hypothetical protein